MTGLVRPEKGDVDQCFLRYSADIATKCVDHFVESEAPNETLSPIFPRGVSF